MVGNTPIYGRGTYFLGLLYSELQKDRESSFRTDKKNKIMKLIELGDPQPEPCKNCNNKKNGFYYSESIKAQQQTNVNPERYVVGTQMTPLEFTQKTFIRRCYCIRCSHKLNLSINIKP